MPITDEKCRETFGENGVAFMAEFLQQSRFERMLRQAVPDDADPVERDLRRQITDATDAMRKAQEDQEMGMDMNLVDGSMGELAQHVMKLKLKLQAHLASKE